MNLHVRPRLNNKNGTIRKQLKKIASNKKTGQLCTVLYRELWPLLFPDISLTYTLFIRKNVNPGKRVALFAEYFLSLSLFSFFFFFFFEVKKKLTPLLKPTSFAHALTRRTVGRAKLFIWGNVDPDRRVILLSNSFSLFVNSNSLYS